MFGAQQIIIMEDELTKRKDELTQRLPKNMLPYTVMNSVCIVNLEQMIVNYSS